MVHRAVVQSERKGAERIPFGRGYILVLAHLTQDSVAPSSSALRVPNRVVEGRVLTHTD